MFQAFISFIQKIKFQRSLFHSLAPGDLVWAKMPLSKKALQKIKESHRIRPYLVVSKNWFYLFACPSSSKSLDKLSNTQEYCISKIRYRQNKDSYINLTQLYKIPFTHLKEKHITLNEIDLKNIQKRLLTQRDNAIDRIAKEIRIIDGDILSFNRQLYYVYSSDNLHLYCFTIFKKCPKDEQEYHTIIVNRKTYYTTFQERITFERKQDLHIVNIAYQSEIEKILRQKKDFAWKQKQNPLPVELPSQNDVPKVGYQTGTVLVNRKY